MDSAIYDRMLVLYGYSNELLGYSTSKVYWGILTGYDFKYYTLSPINCLLIVL